ncbi:MAG: type III pantothenate kinase [Bacteroidota bacterium]
MILAIDIGNSDIVFGFFKNDEEHLYTYRTPTSEEKSSNNYSLELATFLMEKGITSNDIEGACISSVVPIMTHKILELCRDLKINSVVEINSDTYEKLPIKVTNKHEIGTDLVCNATRAFIKMKKPCIIVDFGTALTFSIIGRDGEMLGVAIAPGVKTAFESLFLNTAKLPEVPFDIPSSVFGTDTSKAIQAGVFYGYEGMVKGIIDQIKKEHPLDYRIIGTGGLVYKMNGLSTIFTEIDQLLTLRGIVNIYSLVKGM